MLKNKHQIKIWKMNLSNIERIIKWVKTHKTNQGYKRVTQKKYINKKHVTILTHKLDIVFIFKNII